MSNQLITFFNLFLLFLTKIICFFFKFIENYCFLNILNIPYVIKPKFLMNLDFLIDQKKSNHFSFQNKISFNTVF